MPLGFDALLSLANLREEIINKTKEEAGRLKSFLQPYAAALPKEHQQVPAASALDYSNFKDLYGRPPNVDEISTEEISPLSYLAGQISGTNIAAGAPGPRYGRVGVLTGREKLASDLIKRGLKEPWFHGTKTPERKLPELADYTINFKQNRLREIYERIIDAEGIQNSFKEGSMGWKNARDKIAELKKDAFDISESISKYLNFKKPDHKPFSLDRLGEGMAIKLGEPAGISVSKSPSVAEHFGQPLRVGIDVHPSQVGDLLDPEVLKMYRNAYEKIINQVDNDSISGLKYANYSHDALINNKSAIRRLSADLSAELRKGGLEAVQYNPNRYNELELRVFDPDKVIPLGKARAPYGDPTGFTQRESDAFQRWYDRAVRTKFQDWRDTGRGKPARISEMLEGLPHMKSNRYNYNPSSTPPALPHASEYVTDDFAVHHLAQLPDKDVVKYLYHPDTVKHWANEDILKAINQYKNSPEFANYIKKDPLSAASKEHFYNFSELGNKTKESLESIYGSPVSETLKDKLMQLGMENVMEPVPPKGWENADAFFKSKGF